MMTCGYGWAYTRAELDEEVARRLADGQIMPRTWHCGTCGYWHLGRSKRFKEVCAESGKRIFETQRLARLEMLNTQRKFAAGADRRKECRVYECGNHYHLTSQEKWDNE